MVCASASGSRAPSPRRSGSGSGSDSAGGSRARASATGPTTTARMERAGDAPAVERQERSEVEEVEEEAEKRERDQAARSRRPRLPQTPRLRPSRGSGPAIAELRLVPGARAACASLRSRAEERDEERCADRQPLPLRLEHVAHLVDEEEEHESDPEPPAAEPARRPRPRRTSTKRNFALRDGDELERSSAPSTTNGVASLRRRRKRGSCLTGSGGS